ncbi:UNVERIFIED_CONTAM: hypothetical protein GTU68_040374 [Idotea baltica]|nr:hypothetical protein [Idotea baltica]
MLADWADALVECQSNDSVAAVVLTGAGRAFCAGGDVTTLGVYEDNPALELGDYLRTHVHPVARAVTALQKPYLCAVNGAATGAGMDMALMADIRWAGARARFAESYIKLGLVAGDGGGWLLPRLVGQSKALEMLWTGDMIDADEAERIGIVSRVCDDERLVEEMHDFAARLAAGPTVAIRLKKQVGASQSQQKTRSAWKPSLGHRAGDGELSANTAPNHAEAVAPALSLPHAQANLSGPLFAIAGWGCLGRGGPQFRGRLRSWLRTLGFCSVKTSPEGAVDEFVLPEVDTLNPGGCLRKARAGCCVREHLTSACDPYLRRPHGQRLQPRCPITARVALAHRWRRRPDPPGSPRATTFGASSVDGAGVLARTGSRS